MHKKQDKPEKAAATLNFFAWAYKSGDAQAGDLDYIPMPQSVKDTVTSAWKSIVDTSGKPVRNP